MQSNEELKLPRKCSVAFHHCISDMNHNVFSRSQSIYMDLSNAKTMVLQWFPKKLKHKMGLSKKINIISLLNFSQMCVLIYILVV